VGVWSLSGRMGRRNRRGEPTLGQESNVHRARFGARSALPKICVPVCGDAIEMRYREIEWLRTNPAEGESLHRSLTGETRSLETRDRHVDA
jgi:hypothetical protein